jgi:hypothetical protein
LIRYSPFLALALVGLAVSVLLVPQTYAALLTVTISTNKAVYGPGEDVHITIFVKKGAMAIGGATVSVGFVGPGGPAIAVPASPTIVLGQYEYTYHLSGSGGGVWQLSAHATKGVDSGSAQTIFKVIGPSPKKTVDWSVYDPSLTPATPTTSDPVQLNVNLRIIATLSSGPYPVEIACSVDGIPVGGGTLTVSGMSPQYVSTDPRTYSAGTHIATWVVDPNYDYNDPDVGNNQVNFKFAVIPPAPAFDFSLATSPSSLTVKAGETATFTVAVKLVSGSPSSTILSVTGQPSGAEPVFSPAQGFPFYSSILTISTTPDTATGTYALTLTASSGVLSRTTIVTVIIQNAVEPDFELSVTPTSQTITPSQSTNYLVTTTKNGDFKSVIGLTVSGHPSGVQPSFNPSSGMPDYVSTLTLTTSQTAPAGTYVLTIYASGGGKTKSTVITLVIQTSTQASPITTTQTPAAEGGSIIGMMTEQPYLIIIIVLLLIIAGMVIRGGRKKTGV